ncbi:MAG TPA: SDR family NAD(P)-dependent oxidoreductase [Pseudonocardiaceae bacterium]|jgi:NADP-dependent 3-hydroxy acid dehydrogenase YdfG|nr:SDR family NAD(P)-dependent oxidoreductase [Pseudonocardiaceae bacterium]
MSTSQELRGTVALVTGASSGIGAATAAALAARGASVALVARRVDRLKAVAERIVRDGGAALPVEADVTEHQQVRDAVELTVREWGRLDILINNAGVARPKAIEDATTADFDDLVRVNLLGSLYCANAALPHLLRAAATEPRHVADLVNVSSLSARGHRKGSSVYTATKHAVNAYSECLRQEVAGRRVRVSVLEPAVVDTELFPPDVWNRHRAERKTAPLRPEDVAEVIGYAVTRPAHLALSDLLVRPTELER